MQYDRYHHPEWDQFEDHLHISVRQFRCLDGNTIQIGILTLYGPEPGETTHFVGEYCSERMEESITNMIRHGGEED